MKSHVYAATPYTPHTCIYIKTYMHEHTHIHLHLLLYTTIRLEISLLLVPGNIDHQPRALDNPGHKSQHIVLLAGQELNPPSLTLQEMHTGVTHFHPS